MELLLFYEIPRSTKVNAWPVSQTANKIPVASSVNEQMNLQNQESLGKLIEKETTVLENIFLCFEKTLASLNCSFNISYVEATKGSSGNLSKIGFPVPMTKYRLVSGLVQDMEAEPGAVRSSSSSRKSDGINSTLPEFVNSRNSTRYGI